MTSLLLLLIVSLGIDFQSPDKTRANCKNSRYILEQSQNAHDPAGNWSLAKLAIHIQEPRIQNELRYSILSMDNRTGYFSLTRDSEVGEIERIIDDGTPTVLLNGNSEIDEAIRRQYRLEADRNSGYRSFYRLMYGLPMSINENVLTSIQDAETTMLDGEEVYVIKIELKEVMISKHWELMVDAKDYSLVALKFDHSDDPEWPDEVIIFDGEFTVNRITIPRFRHWYKLESGQYQGSDIIMSDVISQNQ